MGDFRGGPRKDFGPRKMYKATCTECKKECEVPFKPSNDAEGNPRPVFCRDCFNAKKSY